MRDSVIHLPGVTLLKCSDRCPDLHYNTAKWALLLAASLPRIAPSQLRLVE